MEQASNRSLGDAGLTLSASGLRIEDGIHMFDISLDGKHLTTVQEVDDGWWTWGEFEDHGYSECTGVTRADVIRAVFTEVLGHID